MRSWCFTALMVGFVAVTVVTSRSDNATSSRTSPIAPSPLAPDEPITGAAMTPAPGSETPPKDPFAPYDVGVNTWSYGQLTPEEQVVADRARTNYSPAIHAAYANASADLAQRAQAEAAQHQLGIDSLVGAGVVP